MRAHLSFFSPFSGKLIWKISPLVLCKVLVVFVNNLTVDGKYSVQDCEKSQFPIQIELSEKREATSQFSDHFLESTSNFKHFEKKKNDCHS